MVGKRVENQYFCLFSLFKGLVWRSALPKVNLISDNGIFGNKVHNFTFLHYEKNKMVGLKLCVYRKHVCINA